MHAYFPVRSHSNFGFYVLVWPWQPFSMSCCRLPMWTVLLITMNLSLVMTETGMYTWPSPVVSNSWQLEKHHINKAHICNLTSSSSTQTTFIPSASPSFYIHIGVVTVHLDSSAIEKFWKSVWENMLPWLKTIFQGLFGIKIWKLLHSVGQRPSRAWVGSL